MSYGQYGLYNNLNYRNQQNFAGLNLPNKQAQDLTNQSAELAKQNLQQNNAGAVALDTFEGAKEDPTKMIASMGVGLGISGGLGATYKTLTWGQNPADTKWMKFFNQIDNLPILKPLNNGINTIGAKIKGLIPDNKLTQALSKGLEHYKPGQGQLFEMQKELISNAKNLAQNPDNLDEGIKAVVSGLKDLDLEKMSKSEILKTAAKLSDDLGSKIGIETKDKALRTLKGLTNRVSILNKQQGPIAKALSNTAMFTAKMFGGNTLGIMLNTMFVGQTIKAVGDAKPEDRHKVFAEELLGNFVGNWLLYPAFEKGFNAVMNFRNIGLDKAGLDKMANLESLVRSAKGVERQTLMQGIKELSDDAAKNIAKMPLLKKMGTKALKLVGDVLSIGVRKGQAARFIPSVFRVIVMFTLLDKLVIGPLKGIAHTITGAPPKKEEEKKNDKNVENKAPVEQAVNQAQQQNLPKQPISEPTTETPKTPERTYMPSANHEKTSFKSDKKTPGLDKKTPNSDFQIQLEKSDKWLNKAESILKNY